MWECSRSKSKKQLMELPQSGARLLLPCMHVKNAATSNDGDPQVVVLTHSKDCFRLITFPTLKHDISVGSSSASEVMMMNSPPKFCFLFKQDMIQCVLLAASFVFKSQDHQEVQLFQSILLQETLCIFRPHVKYTMKPHCAQFISLFPLENRCWMLQFSLRGCELCVHFKAFLLPAGTCPNRFNRWSIACILHFLSSQYLVVQYLASI